MFRSSVATALACLLLSFALSAHARVERVWLSYASETPDKITVSWQTDTPGSSVVRYGPTAECAKRVAVEESVALHQVVMPLDAEMTVCHYFVETGDARSDVASFKPIAKDVLRVAVVANWHGRAKLDAILKDDVHLLLTAGDNIPSLRGDCGDGVVDCTKPYEKLIDAYPALFRSTPFMPVLGNHDREIRPRGDKPPAEAVYDVEATAFRKFFALPGAEWHWRLDVPALGARFIALDLHHVQDMGTTWQTGHPYDRASEQFLWYEGLMTAPDQPAIVVTILNERLGAMRTLEKGAWDRLLRRGSFTITGFGYFAERTDVKGFPSFNTSLGGKGAKYPDANSAFFASEDNYVLMTVRRDPQSTSVELKSLAGDLLDQYAVPSAVKK